VTRPLVLALVLLAAPAARADWQVRRAPFDAQVVARYKQLLRKNPDDEFALKKLTGLYKAHRTVDALVAEYTAEAERTHDASAQVVLGHLERDRGLLARAVPHYQAALAAWPDDPHARNALADAYVKLQRPAEARPLYEAALAATQDPRARRPLCRKLADLALSPAAGPVTPESVAAARRYYDELLALDPADATLRRELAEALATHGLPKEAAAEWRRLAEQAKNDPPRNAEAWKRVGELDEAAGDDAAALEAYHKTWSIVPTGHYLRREAAEKIIGVHRRKDDLRALVGAWERDWTRRGFFEWDTLARLYDELGDPTRAEECFKKALAADPHAIEARRRLVALLERAGKDAEVIAEYRRLIAAAPGEPRYRLELAERLWKSGAEQKEAIAVCERLGRDTDDPSLHASLAELYTRWGLGEQALAERERLVRLEPDEPSHLVALGELYFQGGKKERAVTVWRRLLNLRGPREQSMARLAEVYAEHDLPGESLELYQKAVKLAPADLALKKGLGGALERMHRLDEAEALWLTLFDDAVAHKQRALTLELRGRLMALLLKRGRLGARVGEFRARFDRASDQGAVAYGLLAADAYVKLGLLDEAEKVLHALVRRAGDAEAQADAWIGLGQVYRGRHRLKQVAAALQKAADLSPSRARELYAQIAELSLQLYQDAEAVAYAEKALALGPADAQAEARLAEVYEKRERVDDAITAYRRALELDDRLWRVYFALARLYLERGEPAPAARLYRDVIRRAPDEELVVDAARRATDLEEYLGGLGELERELVPLAYTHSERHVYRELLLSLYERYVRLLVERRRSGDETAKKELVRLGEHGLRPLTDVLVDGAAAQQRLAVSLLGELYNPSAAAPLLKLAMPPPAPPLAAHTGAARPDIELRTEAAIAGARLATVKEVRTLVRLAEDPEKHVRAAAIFGLGRVRDAAATQALVRALSDGAPDVQALGCLGLGRQLAGSDGAGTSRALAEMLRVIGAVGRAELARAACVVGVGAALDGALEKEVATARAALVDTLGEGGDEVQRRAAWALGLMGGRRAVPALLRAVFLRRDPVRRAALEALARAQSTVGQRRAPSLAWPEPERGSDGLDVRAWLGAVGGTPVRDGEASASPVWRGCEADVAAALADALTRHRDLALRALQDLDARPDGIALGPLTPAAPTPADRAALDDIGARLLATVRPLARHADAAVRARAVRVLGKLGAGDVAVTALDDASLEVRLAALDALGRLVAAGDVEPALDRAFDRALRATDWRERRAAALALASDGTRRPPRALGALASALDDRDGFVRESAARALGAAGAAGVPSLAAHVGDELPEVRAALATALGKSGSSAARAPLDRLAADRDPSVRRAAAAALDGLSAR
jgi:superkiller protein 3